MIEGRAALYKGFLVVIMPTGMWAYRNSTYMYSGIASYTEIAGKDISEIIDATDDWGEFTKEKFDEITGNSQYLGEYDTCIGYGQQFPVQILLYEGVEPITYAPRCNICIIKQAQELHGAKNVILPESWRN